MNELMYRAYVRELGTRLAPVTPILANKIMDGTAGDVPVYGYQILSAAPDVALGILLPNLSSESVAMRERAAVALGYMGESAATAKPKVEAALGKAPTEREKLLMQWCLREIDGE